MSDFIDLTVTIHGNMPTWPGDLPVNVYRFRKIEEGANANASRIEMAAHTGTHLDAPYHFLPDGNTVEALDLNILIGECQVIELPESVNVVTAQELEAAGVQPGVERLLIKTRNSTFWAQELPDFQADFVGVDLSGAEWLAAHRLRLIGIDYLSVAPYKKSRPTHEVLLGAGMIVVEGLDLSHAQPGVYDLICLPLKLGGADGAPCRAVLKIK